MDLFRQIKVLSVEQATVLPYLTYRLVMDGCQVFRVENPLFCDPNRLVGEPFLPGEERMNSYFMAINAGKKALTLNLGDPRGRELLKRLIVDLNVDIFATNQLPKNYSKLGIDYQTLREIKPDIIWLGVTGFGPENNEAAYDPILQARGGLMELTGEPSGSPQVVGTPLPDMGSSEHAYGQIMKALFYRSSTGKGTRIDISMLDSTTSWLTVPITMTVSFKKNITRRGNTHEFFAPVSVYPTRDGYVYIAVGNDKQFNSLASLPEFSSLKKEEYTKNSGRIADVNQLNELIAKVTSAMTSAELLTILRGVGIASSKINTIPELVEDPLIRGKLMKAADTRTGFELTLAPAPASTPFLESVNRTLSFPPRFGEHNEEIYVGGLSMTQEEIAKLRSEGVI